MVLFNKKNPQERAKKHIIKAEKLLKKGKRDKALGHYHQAIEIDPDQKDIYQDLINNFENDPHEDWSEEEFSLFMDSTMKIQEIENPEIKDVHEVLSAEYYEIYKDVQSLFIIPNPEGEKRILERLKAHENKAVLPLLNFILSLKKIGEKQ